MTLAAICFAFPVKLFAQGDPIAIGALKGPSGIGMALLFESPALGFAGRSATVVAIGSADLMTAKVISGEFDAAVLPVNLAAKLYNSGIPIVLGAIVGEGMLSFLCSDSSIKDISDVKGRAVQVSGQGATPDYLFRRLLKTAGIDPAKDVELSYALPYPEAATALAAGKISCALLPEPFATMALAANPLLSSPFDIGELWTRATGQKSYPMTAFVISARLAKEDPTAAQALLKAYEASIAWVVANPDEAGKLAEKHELGLKAPIAAKAIPRSAYVFIRALEARAAIEALLSVFMETAPASVGGKLPNDGFYGKWQR
ncbi:MAG: MqnA/MqnD/SBP family protein [Spirochaetaceae bacterium]|nr:MqnA/MqnD/SBP family protein [Spirochaetaceae bacterium]